MRFTARGRGPAGATTGPDEQVRILSDKAQTMKGLRIFLSFNRKKSVFHDQVRRGGKRGKAESGRLIVITRSVITMAPERTSGTIFQLFFSLSYGQKRFISFALTVIHEGDLPRLDVRQP